MKKIFIGLLGTILLLLVVISISACQSTSRQESSPSLGFGDTQIPNPMAYHQTIDEARKVVGFVFETPAKLPEGYNQNGIATIRREIAQVVYKNGENTITYRTAKGSGDISGDYNTYSTTQTIAVGKLPVTIKGENNSINVAYWTKNDLCYSIVFSIVITVDQLSEIIQSISK